MTPADVDRRIERALARRRLPFRGKTSAFRRNLRVQRAQVSGFVAETKSDLEVFQHFGFTSALPDGTEVILLPINGNSGHAVVLGSEMGALRLRLEKAGETAIYSAHGDYVYIRDGRIVEIKAATKVIVDAPAAEFSGDVHIAGKLSVDEDIEAAGDVSDASGSMVDMRTTYNTHNHDAAGAAPPAQQMLIVPGGA